MDHAKHFQLHVDAKQGYLKQDNQILPLESSWTNIKIQNFFHSIHLVFQVQPIQETSIHLD